MDVKEHAQQIYSMMFAGFAAGGQIPSAKDAPGYAEMAWIYAKAFAERTRKEEGNVI